MSEYQLENVSKGVPEEVCQGVHLIIIEPLNIPPHIMLSIGDTFYSLEKKGMITDGDMHAFFRFIQRTKKPVACVEVLTEIHEKALHSGMQIIAKNHPKIGAEVTCLGPVKRFMQHIAGVGENAKFVFELLPMLEAEGMVGKTHVFNLKPLPLSLPQYTMEQVRHHIQQQSAGKSV